MHKTISIFNNKGGVGKTTYMYHIAHLLAESGRTVLMVDLDSQCNLSAYSISDTELLKSWGGRRGHGGNSIWRVIEPISRGIGDFHKRKPSKIGENLFIIPGDVSLSSYEDLLGDTWSAAKGGSEQALRVQSAIHRYIQFAVDKVKADVVMVDLGPNLGSLNRSVLAGSDYFIIPMSPDLFSIRGTENLGKKLVQWNKEWKQCHAAWEGEALELPKGSPKFLGYVTQQHNARNNADGMTRGWKIFGDRVESSVQSNIVDLLSPLEQVFDWEDLKEDSQLGSIPNLHSLIPYSLEAKKPVFHCTSKEGLTGAHITTAKDSKKHFQPILERLFKIL